MNKVKVDIVDRLRNAKDLNMRPGTADSDVNVYALRVEITYGDLVLAIGEIERLRRELNGPRNVVQWSVANDPIDWSPSSASKVNDALVEAMHQRRDVIAAQVLNDEEPWGSPYAMNPENWK